MNIASTKMSPVNRARKHPETLRLLERNGELALDINNDGRVGPLDPFLARQTEDSPWREKRDLPVTRQDLQSWDKNADGLLESSEIPESLMVGSSRLKAYAAREGLSHVLALDQGTLSAEWTNKEFSPGETAGWSALFTATVAACGLVMDRSMFGSSGLVGSLVGGSLGLAFAGFVLHTAANLPAPSLVPRTGAHRAALI